MANDFSRADIISAWRFESGALGTDVKGNNTLSLVNTPTEDTTNMMEGSCCMSLAGASSQYAKIADADLSAGFPLKSGDTAKVITISCWVRPTTVDANKRVIWSKHKNATGKRCLALVHNSTQIYLRHNITSTTVTDLSMGFGPMTANRKYFIIVGFDGIGVLGTPVYWFRIYDATAGTWYAKAGVTGTGTLSIGNADFRIGADEDLTANCYFDGQIDEVVISNLRLHNSEGLAIKGGNFPVTGVNIYDYLYDPTVAADTYDGFSAVTAAYKTMKHAFYAGDIIYAIKSAETAKPGTATATNGSLFVTGISGWTPVAGDIMRFDSDESLYAVDSYNAGTATITLCRNYQQTTGAAKVVSLVAWQAILSQDLTFLASVGTLANPITFKGGVNFTNFIQDGWSLYAGVNYYTYGKYLYYFNVSKQGFKTSSLGVYYTGGLYNCVLDDLYHYDVSLLGGDTDLIGCTVNRPIIEELSGKTFPGNGRILDTVFNDPVVGVYMKWCNLGPYTINTDVNNLILSGWTAFNTNPVIVLTKNCANYRFINPILEDVYISKNHIDVDNVSEVCSFKNVVLINPQYRGGLYYPVVDVISNNYPFVGEIVLKSINGDYAQQKSYLGQSFSTGKTVVLPDYVTYKDASPSARLKFDGTFPYGPTRIKHQIPCEADVPITISAWLRKNSAPITGTSIRIGGSGYVAGDLLGVVQSGAVGAVLWATGVSGDALQSLTVVHGGCLHSVENNLELVALTGSGTGGRVDITAVGVGYGSITLPYMRLTWFTGSGVNMVQNQYDAVMPDVNDEFQQVSHTITPSYTGIVEVELIFETLNTGAEAWYDKIEKVEVV